MKFKKCKMTAKLKGTHLILLALIMVFALACGKTTKETAKTPDGQGAGAEMSKQEQKQFAADLEADAITMARASCTARSAKKVAERRPESEFYVQKAKNLVAQRNKIRDDMEAKYGKDPETKKQFDAAVEKAKLGLEECKGLAPKKDDNQ
mgnify:CR=1 FL=1